jgi:hypothetical protein
MDPCAVVVLPDDVATVSAYRVLLVPVHHARIPAVVRAARAVIAFPSRAPEDWLQRA